MQYTANGMRMIPKEMMDAMIINDRYYTEVLFWSNLIHEKRQADQH